MCSAVRTQWGVCAATCDVQCCYRHAPFLESAGYDIDATPWPVLLTSSTTSVLNVRLLLQPLADRTVVRVRW
jgi:hypothetical protein